MKSLQQTLQHMTRSFGGNGSSVKTVDDFNSKRELFAKLSADSFEELRPIEKSLIYRCVFESWPAVVVAESVICESRKESCLKEQINSPDCFGLLGLYRPRALGNVMPEDVFKQVVNNVKKLLSGDSNLSPLFLMVVMISYSIRSPQQPNQQLKALEFRLWLILYRCMTTKLQSSVASNSK